MAFPTDDIFLGPASFGLRGNDTYKGQADGIIWHTTEGAGTSRDDALATARFQLTHAGSYNWIIYDGGLLLTVPYLEASGGTNPFSHAWAPERYPFLEEGLPARAYGDPNKWQLNVSFSGRTSEFRKGNIPDNMIETAARLTHWVEAQPWGAPALFHSGHMHWQNNRSDPSEYVLGRIKESYLAMADDTLVNPFIDIDGNTHEDNIVFTTHFGLWAVPADKKFHPDGTLTRAQAATIMARLIKKAGLDK